MAAERVEYLCTWCGRKIIIASRYGRPEPGNCPRKPRNTDGKMKPHTWAVNRKLK